MAKFDIKEFLEMSEDEQWDWIFSNSELQCGDESLADVAFRLRDEVDEVKFVLNIEKIRQLLETDNRLTTHWQKDNWGLLNAQPIHWIAAAIAALKKEAE